MYKKLLISAGGGIVSAEQQAEQNASATIAIGLGGTGISCLRSLKKEIFDRLRPDDPKATVPSSSNRGRYSSGMLPWLYPSASSHGRGSPAFTKRFSKIGY